MGLLSTIDSQAVEGLQTCDPLTPNWTFEPSTPWRGAFVHRLKAKLLERRSPPRRIVVRAPGPRRRWILYFMFLPDGQISPAHHFTLDRLAVLDAGLLVVCALPDPNMVPRAVLDRADAVVSKALPGYAVSACAIGLAALAEHSPGCDVFVMNDSVFGPFADLDREMDTAAWDFTGYTAYSLIENHIQSYAFVLKALDDARLRALSPVLPLNFVYDRYKDVVFQQETRLARVASRQMSVGAKWYAHHRSSSEPTFFAALSLLDAGLPFVKKSLLHRNPGTYPCGVIAAVLEELGHPRP